MEIRRLEVFCKVVELKSFTRAAEAALLSQPTVSEQIRLLEEALGEKLLDRLGREVLPTPAGEILYRYARRILQLRDEAQQAIREFGGRLAGQLRLGASTIPGTYLLPRLLESFKAHHPAIQATLKIAGTAVVAGDLLDGNLELGLIGAPWKDPRLECSELFGDELVLAVHAEHPWSKRRAIAPEELADEPFILRENGSGTRMVMSQALKESGFDPARLTVVAEMESTEAVRQGIKAGLGISILSFLAVEEDVRWGSLMTVPIKGVCMERSFYLIRRKNRQLSPLGLAFFRHLQSAGNRQAPPPSALFAEAPPEGKR